MHLKVKQQFCGHLSIEKVDKMLDWNTTVFSTGVERKNYITYL